ncbi:hypothetical protein [Roseivivax isoporae]|uniref:Uncharacterized protein n=1 Tax=Roseivivax isoporae LMG 25204 TaxID=1449351 RepID=X7FCN3_9RHOB|nr:hypothetical protein [Roseivivax isoporae]ETX30550.1 hypothetical protein RISW2_12850 [Roseivivax isoporae LMG 25204]
MAYSDRNQSTDPYVQPMGADPSMRAPASTGSALAGLGVVLALILAVIFGTSMLGGSDDAATGETVPAVESGAPASDAADAPLAPAGEAPTAGTAAPAE